MENISTQLEVMPTCSALSRPHASPRSGVVSADFGAQYKGTGLPFGGFDAQSIVTPATVRVRTDSPSGITTWSPPV
ncbi:hypothetical protein ACPPVT_16625 [Angustibacter sp. McL0619]|uniref:hypothetical protein n=1 Tax=Angustibacter sp. McL0619 TaxID=3415676 RepID=UPI003CEB1475